MKAGQYCAGCDNENTCHTGGPNSGSKKFKHTCNKLKTRQVDVTKRTKFNKNKHIA